MCTNVILTLLRPPSTNKAQGAPPAAWTAAGRRLVAYFHNISGGVAKDEGKRLHAKSLGSGNM